jgi:hypothetical protein
MPPASGSSRISQLAYKALMELELHKGVRKRLELHKRAAAAGALDTLRWLLDCALSMSMGIGFRAGEVYAAAAAGGHLAVLQLLRTSGCEWDEDTCSGAAKGGHLAVLQWARANGCEWDEATCSAAAGGGHLAVLQWARANGCEWHAATCFSAAAGGHLAVLQWARANGCPWDARIYELSAQTGKLAVLQWARANGCPWNRANCLRWAPAGSEMREWIQAQPA